MPLELFHPLVAEWFASRFAEPTPPQQQGWPHIAAGENTLIAAPTGSGKTLTAFLACLDRLVREACCTPLPNETRVVYVSPLRALSNDMHRNLEQPLEELSALARQRGYGDLGIRCGLRTGDTSSYARQMLVKRPPHLLVTTPESLYLMLTSEKGRPALETAETVILDEIHALVADKRGSHLMLTLERLEHLCGRPLQRIGLSATQKPLDRVGQYLIGHRPPSVTSDVTPAQRLKHEQPSLFSPEEIESLKPGAVPEPHAGRCRIIEVDERSGFEVSIETPEGELGSICTQEQWSSIDFRLSDLIKEHRSTIIFVNTRRLAERVTHELTEILGEDVVGSHHGSLAAKQRLRTEQRLKNGELKAVVATASLELGIDVGHVDLVIQIGSTRKISSFLQRLGRSGHSVGLTSKGVLFALTRDELLESMALVRAIRKGSLDTQIIPVAPLDVLAQQIVAEASARDCDVDELFDLIRRADPFRDLDRKRYDQILEFLSEGVTQTQGRSRAFLHYDHVHQTIRARRGSRMIAMMNGGAIPEIAHYRVITEPEGENVGTLDEHFAVETSRGDVFLLGNNSWRIVGVRGTDLLVTDAHGAPPTIPFWEGESPGRSYELSEEVSKLREELERICDEPAKAIAWLKRETLCTHAQAEFATDYVSIQKGALGLLPTQKRIIFERFFDESGGMQLVVHAPFGSQICKAWGFAMRKRFCRSFDFELQATADDNGFILSLGPQHSFPIESLFPMLTAENCRGLLEQAMFQIPLFQARWRWNVTRSLLVSRMQNGKKVPPALQRFRADDLLTAVFPKLTGCQEEHTGDHELPDHPLTVQTMHDCLHEALDLPGLVRVLKQIAAGEVELIARDTREPSPFAMQLLGANPYAFLDGGEAQERRARAVATRRGLDAETMQDLGRLDIGAIQKVRSEVAHEIRSADELHCALMTRVVLPKGEVEEWQRLFDTLTDSGRACEVILPAGTRAWVAAERLPAARAIYPEIVPDPRIEAPPTVRHEWTSVDARIAMLRGLMETSGPLVVSEIAHRYDLGESITEATLVALEGAGRVLRGHYTPTGKATGDPDAASIPVEWVHRRVLTRIHRLTLDGLRKQIEPVPVSVFIESLFERHGLTPRRRRSGTNGLFEVVSLLQGIDVPAVCWERDLLAARLDKYDPAWLDELSLTGEVGWCRLRPRSRTADEKPTAAVTKAAPISLWLRTDLPWLTHGRGELDTSGLSTRASEVFRILSERGASFAADLQSTTSSSPDELSEALGELVARGLVSGDGYSGLRHLITQKRESVRPTGSLANPARRRLSGVVGRWVACETNPEPAEDPYAADSAAVTAWAWQLLRRWGVVFRDLVLREAAAPNWFSLLQVYRRLEARGEIRGGRFVAGVGGEQFCLSETVRHLRTLRDRPRTSSEVIIVAAADPVNLLGVVTQHAKVPANTQNRVAWRDGVPIAALQAGEVVWFADLPEADRAPVERALRSDIPLSDKAARQTTSIRPRPRSLNVDRSGIETVAVSEPKPETPEERTEDKPPVQFDYPNGMPRPVIW